jgi:hypothetical protein
MGTPPDFDPTPVGCQGKIDFLFVISSHFEMTKYQDRLKAAFPVFVGPAEAGPRGLRLPDHGRGRRGQRSAGR